MAQFAFKNSSKFKTPEEELKYLRTHVGQWGHALIKDGKSFKKDHISNKVISLYKQNAHSEVMHKSALLSNKEIQDFVSRLKSESHDAVMEELLGILLAKGVANTLAVVRALNNRDISDDFHAFLIKYVHSVHEVPKLEKRTNLPDSFGMQLFEVSISEPSANKEHKKDLKDIFSSMERFYTQMHSISADKKSNTNNHLTFELARTEGSNKVILLVAIPVNKISLFKKELLHMYPHAKLSEMSGGQNLNLQTGATAISYATLAKSSIYPIKLYDAFTQDPLEIIINTLNNLDTTKENASVQFTICPENTTALEIFYKDFEKTSSSFKLKEGEMDNSFSEKIKSTIMATNIRIRTKASSSARALEIQSEIESSFDQFAGYNSFVFHRPQKDFFKEVLEDFSIGAFSTKYILPLNLKELATIFHF